MKLHKNNIKCEKKPNGRCIFLDKLKDGSFAVSVDTDEVIQVDNEAEALDLYEVKCGRV